MIRNLSDAEIRWLANGKRGTSSETLFTVLTGVKCLEASEMSHPLDPSDFMRCRLLLEACPELRACLDDVHEVSPEWRGPVLHWAELEVLVDSEIPLWRSSQGDAPRTYDRMRAIFNDARRDAGGTGQPGLLRHSAVD